MDYNIKPVSKVCAGTGEPLEPGSTCWSVLVESDGKLVRQDYSEAGWDGPPENSLGHWQCSIPSDKVSVQKLLDTDSMLQYFTQLCESPNHLEQDYQYVLALMLLRKRRLVLEENIEIDDMPAMRLIGTGGEGPFEIVERELSDEQVLQLQNQLFGVSAEQGEAA